MNNTDSITDRRNRHHHRRRPFYRSGGLLLLTTILTVTYSSCRIGMVVVDASHCNRNNYCGWGKRRIIVNDDDIGCDYPPSYYRRHNTYFPRTYNYHRRPYGGKHEQRCWNTGTRRHGSSINKGDCVMDLLTRDILSVPLSMINSLLRQNWNHQQKVRRSYSKRNSHHAVHERDPRTDDTHQPVQPSNYAIDDMGSHLELTLEVPGVDGRDLVVELIEEKGAAILHVRGTRYTKRFGLVVESTFTDAFEFLEKDIQIDVNEIKVRLSSSGILTITLPKKQKRPSQPKKKRRLDISVDGDGQDQGQYESIPVEKSAGTGEENDRHENDDGLYISEEEDVW